MADYFLLLGAAVLFGSQIIFTKLFEKKCGSGFTVSIVFTLISSIISVIIMLIYNRFTVNFTFFSVYMALLLSLESIAANILGIKACSMGPMSIYTLFLMLGGMLIPFFVGAIWLKEQIKPIYILAFILLGIALVLPTLDKKGRNKAQGKTFVLFLIICTALFFLNGANSVIGKLHQINQDAVGFCDFLLTEYLFKTGITAIIFLFCKGRKEKYKLIINKYSLASGLGYSIVHVAASLILLYCATTVDASFEYPLVTGGTLIFTPIMGLIFFKEKPNLYVVFSVLISVIATVLFVF